MTADQITAASDRHGTAFEGESGQAAAHRGETLGLGNRPPFFPTAVAESAVPIVVIDPDARLRVWNLAAQHLFGCSAEDVIDGTIPILRSRQGCEPSPAMQESPSSVEGKSHSVPRGKPVGDPAVSATAHVDRVRGIEAIVFMFADRAAPQAATAGQEEPQTSAVPSDIGRAGAGESRRLLQTVTDASTMLSGAQFGAASYYVADERGDYLLYARSTPFRRALGSCTGPPDTDGSASTLGSGAVARSDEAPAGGTSATNMPHMLSPEHSPASSYVAVPMMGRSGKILGALYLDHPDPAAFTEDSKQVVIALAAHAARAIDSAFLDEADRRARIAAEAANRTKDDFLAVLGHELRNPLSTVRAGIATARSNPGRRDRALELATHGVEQLSRLADDLLDVASIAQGKTTLRRKAVSLAQIVERATDGARPLIEERRHTITVSLLDNSLQVDGDALRLEQVIANLISNAAKYMDRGGRIAVAVAQEDGEAVVRVRDTGIGIAAEMLPRVFDLFTQAEPLHDGAPDGMGIGLALVQHLVELHGGRVAVHSDGRGKGAEFVVRLPVLRTTAKTAAPRLAPADDAEARACVLVVEDNANAAEMMATLLERRGHQVRAVRDGPAALEAALADPPDVMLVDVGLPGMDGYTVAQTVRQHEGLRHVNLVALTSFSRDEDRQRALAAGFDHYLPKPVNIDKLRGLVAQLAATPKPTIAV